MKPDKIKANSAMMPEVSRMKASVHKPDDSARQNFFNSTNDSKLQDERDPFISKKDTASKSAFIPKKSNVIGDTKTCKSESSSDSNVLKDNLSEEVTLQHCDKFQMDTNEDFDAVDTEEVPELSRKKSTGDQHSISKKWRIEDLLKNLVGKKPSPLLTAHKKKTLSDQDLTEEEALVHQSSVKISVSDIHKMHSTAKNQMTFKSTSSLNTMSTSGVRHNLWSVMPLLSRKDDPNAVKKRVIRNQSKSIHNLLEPMQPMNRLRNSKSCYIANSCSRCSSLQSLSAHGSNSSLAFLNRSVESKPRSFMASVDYEKVHQYIDNSSHHLLDETADFDLIGNFKSKQSSQFKATYEEITCKLCLNDCKEDQITKIKSCGCFFCIECMKAYVEFEISEGAYELSCPDALCSSQGVVSFEEISNLASDPSLVEKHQKYRLNREVELDKNRFWCPNRNCETICSVFENVDSRQPSSSNLNFLIPRAVICLTCKMEFCSNCKKEWHPSLSCEENGRKLGSRQDSIMLFDNDLIKCCPMCSVPIEKDEGCAQMMCKRCKHVFCWYCLSSLDDDFLLRHYDKGPCKNKLGHSRASVVWHRAQVIGIFAGFGILLLVASPLLLLAAPCIVCCKCKIEESSSASKVLDNVQLDDL